MKLTPVAKALTVVATRLGMAASVRAKHIAMQVVVSPIKLAYELGDWIMRVERIDAFGVNDGAGVLGEMFTSFFKSLTNDAALADAVAMDFIKALHDEAGFTDVQIIDFFKTLVDQAQATDHVAHAFVKDLTDAVWVTDDIDGEASILDEQVMAFVKERTELSFVSDAFLRVVQFKRAPEDAAATQDVLFFSGDKALADTTGAADTLTYAGGKDLQDQPASSDALIYAATKALTDQAAAVDAFAVALARGSIDISAGANDQLSVGPGLGKSDSAQFTDTGSLRSQGYSDFSYFAEDYVGASRTF
jgi:hypothetical protein